MRGRFGSAASTVVATQTALGRIAVRQGALPEFELRASLRISAAVRARS